MGEVCEVIRAEATPQVLRNPPRCVTLLAECLCIVFGLNTASAAYWGEFRRLIVEPELHKRFCEFNLSTFTHEMFTEVLQRKEANDAGMDRLGRQQPPHLRTSF